MITRSEEGSWPFMARQNVLSFAMAMSPVYQYAWHLRLIAEKLQEMERRKLTRLMIFMPPRHGKSFLISQMFPGWYLGHHPEHQVIFTSYSDDVATDFGRKIRNMMRLPQYQTVFPGVSLSDDSSAANRFHTNKGGALFAVGANGTLTSRGGNLIVIDDIHKNRAEAHSPVKQAAIHNWFGSTLYTRLAPGGIMILVQTRWTENDLPGWILRERADMGFEVLELPAICDKPGTNPFDHRGQDEALWPEWFDVPALQDIKATLGSYDFEALYQQRPTAPEGSIIKRQWIRNYFTTPPAKFDEMLISVDCTFKDLSSSDYVVMGVWGKHGANKYLLDLWRQRAGFTATCDALQRLSGKWPSVTTKLIEDKANGSAVIDAMKNKVSGIIGFSPKDSKTARLHAVSPQFEAGNIWLPDPSIAPWVHDYVQELTSFPAAPNDDQVDMTTQALLRWQTKTSGDFLENLVPKSNKTIAARRGDDQW